MERRTLLQGLAGSLFGAGPRLLSRLPGPPMLSAALIARRGDGAVALRAIDGAALRSAQSPWREIAFGYDDPFRVASVSKMIAATGFTMLARARGIDLDADISGFLGEKLRHPAFPDIAITCRMLLSHCSGLRNGADFPVPFGGSLLGRLASAAKEPGFGGWFAPATEPPGPWFSYSDTNFGILAQIVERVGGVRFDRHMRDALFAPLGLDIGYNWSGVSQRKRDRAAAGARRVGDVWEAQVDASPPRAPAVAVYAPDNPGARDSDYRLGENGFAFAPQGGLRLSVNDMDRLARFYARSDARLLPSETLVRMTTPAWTFDPLAPNGATENGFYQRYGLGVQCPLGRSASGVGDAFFGAETADWRGHFGDAYGWMTGLFWNVRDRRTLVYALNGMPGQNRPPARRSALTAPEDALVDLALASFR